MQKSSRINLRICDMTVRICNNPVIVDCKDCGESYEYYPQIFKDGSTTTFDCDCGNKFIITANVRINYDVVSFNEAEEQEKHNCNLNRIWEELRSKYPSESLHPLFCLNHYEEAYEKLKELEGE
jgi:hypothetical protein